VASVPAVASAQTNQEKRAKIRFSLLSTLAVALPCAIGLFLLAGTAQKLVYPALSTSDGQTLITLVRIFAISTLTLSCTQTLSACLTTLGKPLSATLSMAIGMVVKTLLCLWWVSNPRFSIYGVALATNFGYLVAFLLDLYYNIKVTKDLSRKTGEKRSKDDSRRRFGCKKRRLDGSG
jgi:stage V sporulation protein B